MIIIERGFDLWAGDIPWLLARSIVMIERGLPKTDIENQDQDRQAIGLFRHGGSIWKE